MSITIIPNSRAVLIRDNVDVIVISDIHLNDDGMVGNIVQRVSSLVKRYKPDVVVVDGDLFNFGNGGYEASVFEERVSKIVKVEIVQGNHDPPLFTPYIETDNYVICHGDIDYNVDKKDLVLGHTHPFYEGKPVFVKGTLKDGRKFVVLPPFNVGVGGPDIVEERDLLLGFVFKNDLIKNARVYNLDGKFIGRF